MNVGADPDPQLALHRPQWPLRNFTVHKYGAFGAKRFNAKQGACGTKPYPCTHYGADLSAPEGSPVYVPFDGYLLYHGPADDPPFRGYGPYVALIAHADRSTSLASRVWDWATGPLVDAFDFPEAAKSVRYSLIGHLAKPGTVAEVPTPPPGEPPSPIGSMVTLVPDIWDASKVKPDREHWMPIPSAPQNVIMMSEADGNTDARKVFAGQKLGHVSNANHVHWELRTSPIQPAKGGTWRLDPVDVFQQAYGLGLPTGARVASTTGPNRGGGGAGMLLLLAALAFGKRKRSRR